MSTRVTTHRVSRNETGGPSLWLAGVVCALATSFLLYNFILQTAPSVMSRQLMYDFRLNSAWFGIVMAFCSLSYTLMQIPAGMLIDQFGPRKLLTLATLTCAMGALSFGFANGWIALSTGRFLIGVGSAFAFSGALVIVANWLPARYFAVSAGIVQLSSSIGAIGGQKYLVPFIHTWGWRDTTNYLGYVGLLLAVSIWLIVRDAPGKASNVSKQYDWQAEKQKLLVVLRNPQSWWIGVYALAVWAPIASFAGLWGISFLKMSYRFNAQAASNALALTWLGIGLGSPLLAWYSDVIQKRRSPLAIATVVGIASWLALLCFKLSPFWLYLDLFIIGLAASGQTLSFTIIKENNRPDVTGTAVGINNTAVVAGGTIFQPLLGFLLEWDQRAFLVLPLCYAVALLVSQFLIEETNCQAKYPRSL